MYGVRPARYTIEEITAQAANAIKDLPKADPAPFVWSPEVRRYVINSEYVQFKNGKFQEV
jgi:hypothetical protein